MSKYCTCVRVVNFILVALHRVASQRHCYFIVIELKDHNTSMCAPHLSRLIAALLLSLSLSLSLFILFYRTEFNCQNIVVQHVIITPQTVQLFSLTFTYDCQNNTKNIAVLFRLDLVVVVAFSLSFLNFRTMQ